MHHYHHPSSSGIIVHPDFYHQALDRSPGPHLKEWTQEYPPLLPRYDPLLRSPGFFVLDHSRPNHLPVIYKKGKVDCANLGFEANIDVGHYLPQEIDAKVVLDKEGDPILLVEGKHEERMDEHGFIYRQFKRRYSLPQNIKREELLCNLSNDGILSITAPEVKMIENHKDRHVGVGGVHLPIHWTGKREICCEKKRDALLGNEGCGRVQGAEAKTAQIPF